MPEIRGACSVVVAGTATDAVPLRGSDDSRVAGADVFATKDDLRAQTNRYIGWMVASNATLVAAVSLIVGLR